MSTEPVTRLSKRQARRAAHARHRPAWQVPQPSARAAWAMRLLLPVTALVMVVCAALLLFTVGQALHSGVAISPSRIGPATFYPLATHPLGYCLTLLLHSVIAFAMAGVGWFCWRVSRLR